jgi:hypothetical protein
MKLVPGQRYYWEGFSRRARKHTGVRLESRGIHVRVRKAKPADTGRDGRKPLTLLAIEFEHPDHHPPRLNDTVRVTLVFQPSP